MQCRTPRASRLSITSAPAVQHHHNPILLHHRFNSSAPFSGGDSSTPLKLTMSRRGHVLALAVAGLLLVALTPLAAGMPWPACGGNTTGNYTANSTYGYGGNLRLVAAALPSNVSTSPALFATAATGAEPNMVYALRQCRGDQDASACRDCIAAAFGNAQRLCPDKRVAAVFYDVCQIGFSDRDFLTSTTNSDDQEFLTGAIAFDAAYPNIYGMASCTPDLTPGECRGCLDATIAEFPQQFPPNTKGARITGLRCALRYEVYPFYNGTGMLQLPVSQAGKKIKTGIILAIVLPTAVAIVAIIALFLFFWTRIKSKRSLSFASPMEGIESIESLLIDLPTLRLATDNFSEKNKLGEGGFGAVYKGSLPNGQQIAVKRLSQNSRQGIGELKNELVLIANLQHKNLVRLVGVCLQDEEKLLVYEYMPNTSLDTFLFDSKKRKELDWSKSGYMAPEYALRGQYSMKSDIYSFGVLILEILTGTRNSDTYNSDQPVDLPSLIWEHWTMKTITEMIDPYLRSEYSSREDILRCIHIGLSCVQEDPVDRPNMSAISIMLDSSTVPSQAPTRPAFHVEMSGDVGSGLYSQSSPRVDFDEPTTIKTGIILAIVLPAAVAIVAIIALFLFFWTRIKSKRSLSFASPMEGIESIESLLIDLPTLRLATDNFSEKNKLGEGGFGAVYKGSLPNGQQIAVKRLSQNSRQGIGELKNELVLIVNLQHKNLVRLVGVCLQDEEKLLVYEYMPNTSLDTFLFDSKKRKELDWSKRFNIINGIARGLQYLHEDSQLKIIHRDLKASNVLLDVDMNPKISDFGLARLFGGDQSQDTTNRVVGTYGYMAPEYALRGQYSMKSDIYSFGVLILEILTGTRNSDTYNSDQPVDLPSLIWEHWTMKTITEMIDPYLRSEYSSREDILRCIHIGLSCVQEDPVDRPNMSAISIMLDSSTVPSQAPTRPAFHVEMSGDVGSGLYSQSSPRVDFDEPTTVMSSIEVVEVGDASANMDRMQRTRRVYLQWGHKSTTLLH
ncbi:hypothetical protein EJB05_24984, partial [Eragrostis curvula]